MRIGTIKEIKDNENRVGLTPTCVRELKKNKHTVYIQKGAGVGAGFSDQEYKQAGAILLNKSLEVIKKADLVVKIKEPLKTEYTYFKHFQNKTLFTYLHLAAAPKELTLTLLKNNITGIAYETVEKNRTLPLLKPMSIVAGILAIQYAAQYLQIKYKGRGITLGRVPNAERAHVVIIGGGTVGSNAAITAAGVGAKVTVLNRSRIKEMQKSHKKVLGPLAKNIQVIKSSPKTIAQATKQAHVLIGAVLIKGAKAPQLVSKQMVQAMPQGAVIVDVAVDQGGTIWGTKPTSHTKPIYTKEGKVYCNIPNMPGQVARQATQALTAATLPYIKMIAANNWQKNAALKKGLNTYKGKITYPVIAKDLNLEKYLAK